MQTSKTFSIIFFTRKSRSHVGKLSIYARITVNGKRSEISLKRSVLSKDWDRAKSRGRGYSNRTRVLNQYLHQSYNQLLDCQKQLLQEGKIVTAQSIKSRYLGEDDNHKILKELVSYHNSNMTSVLKFGTMKNY
ncbi:hypothetical protein BWZ22_12635 [Seonamhaeicola sp. S2-3]|uniref:Arm DNA-binding domain-containing protein n=1 Tax=Seonamhaeicola sp. S2-3 TaxID=1936081 RepID=UPI0009727C5E|nr:Arm DNA-binding domain-containing protein [Seonamhaeicola sp. S2-3]APY12022.1 hypothetical protein BWZ22_12635 [Seonamhaeicola sp. S2-3]